MVAATIGFVSSYLSLVLKGFLDAYPKIHLFIEGGDYARDLKLREVDILMHPYLKDEPDLIQRELCTFHEMLYASPDYLKEYGTPQKPEDLDHHRLLLSVTYPNSFGESEYWHLRLGAKKDDMREPYLSISTSIGLFNAAESGIGIVSLPKEHPDLKTSNLVPVLPHINDPTVKAYAIYLNYFKGLKRIELFCDYLEEVFKKETT